MRDDAEVIVSVVGDLKRENDETQMPTDIQATILEIVLSNGGQAEYDQVMKMYCQRTTWKKSL